MSISSRRLQRRTNKPHARYYLWAANASWPTDAEIQKIAARKLAIIVINSDSGSYAAKIKALDPGVKVYAYVCLASARSYEPTTPIAGSVAYNSAVANNWLALDTNGAKIQWGQYGGHYQTTVWDTAYQDAYIDHISSLLTQSLWDGIWADNDFWTMSYYTSALLAGTTSQAETDQKLRNGFDTLVERAGAVARSYNKVFMPNYGDGKLDPARQARHAAAGGGVTEEMFCNWPHTIPPEPMISGDTWFTEVNNIRDSQVDAVHTPINAGDTRTALYGFTSFLLKAQPGDAWTANPTDITQSVQPWLAFQDRYLGYPRGPMSQQGSVFTREFDYASIAVNPTATSQTVVMADGMTRSLQAQSGIIV